MLNPLVISVILLVVFVIGGGVFSATTKVFYALAFTGVGAIMLALVIITWYTYIKYAVPNRGMV